WDNPAEEVETDTISRTTIPQLTFNDQISRIKTATAECVRLQREQFAMVASQCSIVDSIRDELILQYPQNYHHYTLYYYDRASNLTKTIPPEGVNPLQGAAVNRNTLPIHDFPTTYNYNSLGQLLSQNTPDGGTTQFVYDPVGRLRFSQNAKQFQEGTYAYTKYDYLGRVTEVGKYNPQSAIPVGTQQDSIFVLRINGTDQDTLILDGKTYVPLDVLDSLGYVDPGVGYTGFLPASLQEIEGTDLDPLYWQMATPFHKNNIPVPDPYGAYKIRVHFAETWYIGGGFGRGALDTCGDPKRVFDVRIEGKIVSDDLHIACEAGGVRRALVKEYVVDSVGAILDLDFLFNGPDQPVVAAIEVMTASYQPPILQQALADQQAWTGMDFYYQIPLDQM
ncbi:MAG: malectin domain-containing carbohydrate-binding protein, partial [Bacteroidota bacterium]